MICINQMSMTTHSKLLLVYYFVIWSLFPLYVCVLLHSTRGIVSHAAPDLSFKSNFWLLISNLLKNIDKFIDTQFALGSSVCLVVEACQVRNSFSLCSMMLLIIKNSQHQTSYISCFFYQFLLLVHATWHQTSSYF